MIYTMAVDWHRDIAPYEIARAFSGSGSDDEARDFMPGEGPAPAGVTQYGSEQVHEFLARVGAPVVGG